MKKPHHQVTDHALVRYCDRVLGIDMEALRRDIGRRVDVAVRAGACGMVIDGFSYRIADGVVTTVLDVSRPDPRTGRKRAERDEDSYD